MSLVLHSPCAAHSENDFSDHAENEYCSLAGMAQAVKVLAKVVSLLEHKCMKGDGVESVSSLQ